MSGKKLLWVLWTFLPVLSGQSQQGRVWVCEAMPMTHSSREGTQEELGLTSNSSRALGRSNGRDWLFQVRTGPGVARAQAKAAARDWATKCLHLEHRLDRNLPQAAVSEGLWVNPLEVKNLADFSFPFSLTSLGEWNLFLQGVGGGGEEEGSMECNVVCCRLCHVWSPAQVPAALKICDELRDSFVPRSGP